MFVHEWETLGNTEIASSHVCTMTCAKNRQRWFLYENKVMFMSLDFSDWWLKNICGKNIQVCQLVNEWPGERDRGVLFSSIGRAAFEGNGKLGWGLVINTPGPRSFGRLEVRLVTGVNTRGHTTSDTANGAQKTLHELIAPLSHTTTGPFTLATQSDLPSTSKKTYRISVTSASTANV